LLNCHNAKNSFSWKPALNIHSPAGRGKFHAKRNVTGRGWGASFHQFGDNILTRRGLLACCSWVRWAQAEEPVYDLAPGITPPRFVKQVNPRPPADRGVRATGSVIIGLVVSSKGIPQDPHIIRGLDKDLDQSAVEAVKEWRFAAAQKDGTPVAVRISLQIQFHEM